jgi:hypothetical protein
MGLFRYIHDWFLPHSESKDESLRRGVREQVHSFRNHAMVETAKQKQAQEQLSEMAKTTRRVIKRLEIARERANREQRTDNG